ncbi:MAG: helix-hairpin-helix domain-containing protein [Butyrivibrio sp.]|nr:helix-hairpin-helix domain-containing protein [Butyrivibrio sp.]
MQKILLKYFFITFIMTSLLLSGCDKKNNEIVLQMEEDSLNSQETDKDTEDKTDSVEDAKEQREEEKPKAVQVENSDKEENPIAESIMVHVCGAVLCEGVYELPGGSRVVDAIKAAGGFTADADTSYVNQASVLEDGSKLKIPTIEEVLSLNEGPLDNASGAQISESNVFGVVGDNSGSDSSTSSDSQDSGGKININTASEAELQTIPGIGPSKASSIVSFRQENGNFSTIEDIMNVSGIKEKFFSKIKDYIRV